MGPIVNLFLTLYFAVASGKHPRSLAHRRKYITPSGRGKHSIGLTL